VSLIDLSIKIAIAIIGISIGFSLVSYALAEDCPKGASSCKVVVMTPEEIATLIQPGGVFDQSTWANRSGMTSIVEAWKKKIETSPNGTVKADEPKQ
jgi:hypothetical protein